MRAIYNRYRGNTGQVERVEEDKTRPAERFAPPMPPEERTPLGSLSGLSGELEKFLQRLSPAGLETEDLLLIGILYLLYRDSGDRDFLLAIAGLLFF